ncbi:MAG: hypothetical protein HYV97_04190 [Bdellovibrio sp.]|nr:hypothetical protein [Bdellovibrio sp.]
MVKYPFLPLFLLGLTTISQSWSETCRALMFNGAPTSSCAAGLNDSSYEMDLLRYASTLPAGCQGTKLSGNSGRFSCLRSEEVTREGFNPTARPDGAATINNFETNFQNSLIDASSTGDSFQLYMTDHGSKARGGDFSVSAFNPNAATDPSNPSNMSYSHMANIIRGNNGLSIRTNADGTTEMRNDDIIRRQANVHAVLDHCNSGGGLSLLMKAGIDSVGSTVCGVAAADADDWSYTSITLSKLRADFFREFGRAPSDGELHRMATRHACYPSVPQLSSDLYLQNVVFSSNPYLEESDGTDMTIPMTGTDPIIGRNNTMRGMCLAQGLNLPEVPFGISTIFRSVADEGNRKFLEERVKAMSDDLKKTLAEAGGEKNFSSCGALGLSTLQCYMGKMDSSLASMQDHLDALELKHKIELNKSLAKELGVTIPTTLKQQLNSSDLDTKNNAADKLAGLVEAAKDKLLNLESRSAKVIHHLCESEDGRCQPREQTLNEEVENTLKNELLERARQTSSYKQEARATKIACDEQKTRCDRVRTQVRERCKSSCGSCPTGGEVDVNCRRERSNCQVRCDLSRVEEYEQSYAGCGFVVEPLGRIRSADARMGMGYSIPSCDGAVSKCSCQQQRMAFEERQQARLMLYHDRSEAPEKIRSLLDKQRELQFAQWNKEGAYKSKFKNLRRAKSGAAALANLFKLLKQGRPHQIRSYSELLACEREGIPEGEEARTSGLTPSRVQDCR